MDTLFTGNSEKCTLNHIEALVRYFVDTNTNENKLDKSAMDNLMSTIKKIFSYEHPVFKLIKERVLSIWENMLLDIHKVPGLLETYGFSGNLNLQKRFNQYIVTSGKFLHKIIMYNIELYKNYYVF